MNLNGKTALVTGGAIRIGRAICEALADCGCNVVVHYDHSAKEAGELVELLEARGVRAFAVRGHLGSSGDCGKLLDAAFKKAGPISILVNNAAIFHKDTLASLTTEGLISQLGVNFLAPAVLTKEFAARLMTQPGARRKSNPVGKVINLLDRRITGNDRECVSYVLSKKMLAQFTEAAALELAPRMTVNGVAPGAVLAPARVRTGKVVDYAGEIPMKSQPSPADVAAAVVFLLEAGSITGQTIFVDGGQHLVR